MSVGFQGSKDWNDDTSLNEDYLQGEVDEQYDKIDNLEKQLSIAKKALRDITLDRGNSYVENMAKRALYDMENI